MEGVNARILGFQFDPIREMGTMSSDKVVTNIVVAHVLNRIDILIYLKPQEHYIVKSYLDFT